ncbi:Uncharacterised protein [Rhodococcus rhodochrous]|nr:Uncharacterised protein [Rhodococcus rhodochrous]
MKRHPIVWIAAGVLFAAGCSAGGQDDANQSIPGSATTSVATSSSATSTTASPTSSVSATSVTSTTSEESAPPAAPTELPAQPVVEEPYVVECLEGTPGPALYSDGTYVFSQWCFDQLGGDEYLRAEREANTFECDGTVCRNPYTGVTFPDRNAAPSAPTGTTSDRGYSCNSTGCYWPDGTPVINADRCGLRCDEPPTSGDIQTQHGCGEGYITDPDLCGAYGY